MNDLNLKICRSAHFDSLESANKAFANPSLFVELRFDLSGISIDQISKLKLPKKFIFTCRQGKLNDQERLNAYSFALELGVDYIDLDFEIDRKLIEDLKQKIHQSETQLILSQHNYDSTPDHMYLVKSTQMAFDLGADIAKIITTAKASSDLDRIYKLYQDFDHLVAFAMGNLGMESRARILGLGAPFTYAAFSEKEKTAAGQMDIEQTVKLYNTLKF